MIYYHLYKLGTFLKRDPVKKTLDIRLLGQLSGLISHFKAADDKRRDHRASHPPSRRAGMVVGRFEPKVLFALGSIASR